jgi:16S rRNA (guanine966-N2)-methyltransferase
VKTPGTPALTGGSARGRKLASPVPEGVRPTSARVREAVFSLVGHDLAGVRVLDAYGGTGLLALEAWSRGATVTVVERDRKALAAIRTNAKALGADLDIRAGDLRAVAPALGPFDGVMADPPYDVSATDAVELLAPLAGAWLVLETASTVEAPEAPAGLSLDRRRRYGGTMLTVYRRE